MRRKLFYDYAAILLGAVLTALGLDLFLVPNRIAAGGVSGLATVIHYWTGAGVGFIMLLINLPLLWASLRMLGHEFVVRTLFGTIALSVATDVLAFLPPLTLDPLLASFYGGILSGVGIGITLKWRGSTGGTDLAATLVHRYIKTSVGQALILIDFGIILLAGIAFRSAELALYALITLFLTSRTIDVVQEGMIYAKAAYIISDRTEEIARRVLDELGRGATILQGWGAYTGRERRVLLVIVARSEIAQLKEIALSQDPRAFVVISEAHEVLGEGFKLEATSG